jgi:hypothetical protein
MAEQVPMWANNPAGKIVYQFSHYALHQPMMLGDQFKISKTRGMTSLAKWAAAQAVIGEPMADFWAALRGEERPETVAGRGLENILAAQALGIPYEIYKKLAHKEYAGVAGVLPLGPTIGGGLTAAGRVASDLGSGEPGKAVEDLLRARVRGDIPFGGPPIPAGAMIDRLIPREDIERGKKEGKKKKYNVRSN